MTDLFPDVKRRFDEAPFIRHLGMELTAAEPGVARSRLVLASHHMQQDGFAHAGVVATLADHTGGGSGWTCVSPAQTVLTVEYKIHLLEPARGPVLTCEGRVLRAGRRLITSEVEVWGGDGKRAAKLTMTLAVVETARLRGG